MTGYLELLRNNPGYARLWLAQAISLFGDWFNTIALSALVVKYTGGANSAGLAVSGLLLARFLPPLFVGPLAGVLADRLDRKRLLILSDVLRTGVVLLFLFTSSPDRLWLIYALTVLQFCISAVFEPARSALVPGLVRPEDLVRANTLGSVTWSVMLAIGAVVGGAVASLLGTAAALIIDSASFALSAAFISSIRVGAQVHILPSATGRQRRARPSRRDLVDGLRYVAQHPATGAALLIKLGGNIGSFDTLVVIYATQIFAAGGKGESALGVLYSAFGIGAVLGPVVLNRFHGDSVPTMRRLVSIGYLWVTLGWFLFGAAQPLLLAALAVVVKAMGSSIYWTYSSVILQKTVPDEFLGRLFSLDLAGFQLAVVVSALATGWLLDSSGLDARTITLVTGVASLAPLLLWTAAIPWIERRDVPVPAVGD